MTNDIYVIIGIAVGVITLLTALAKTISKITHVYDVIDRLNTTIEQLIKRVDTIDQRIYDNAVRNSQRR